MHVTALYCRLSNGGNAETQKAETLRERAAVEARSDGRDSAAAFWHKATTANGFVLQVRFFRVVSLCVTDMIADFRFPIVNSGYRLCPLHSCRRSDYIPQNRRVSYPNNFTSARSCVRKDRSSNSHHQTTQNFGDDARGVHNVNGPRVRTHSCITGQVISTNANESLINRNGESMASELIGQPFDTEIICGIVSRPPARMTTMHRRGGAI